MNKIHLTDTVLSPNTHSDSKCSNSHTAGGRVPIPSLPTSDTWAWNSLPWASWSLNFDFKFVILNSKSCFLASFMLHYGGFEQKKKLKSQPKLLAWTMAGIPPALITCSSSLMWWRAKFTHSLSLYLCLSLSFLFFSVSLLSLLSKDSTFLPLISIYVLIW